MNPNEINLNQLASAVREQQQEGNTSKSIVWDKNTMKFVPVSQSEAQRLAEEGRGSIIDEPARKGFYR